MNTDQVGDGVVANDILGQIMAERRAAVVDDRRDADLGALQAAADLREHHSLSERLRAAGGTCIIAETKKASPSAGLMRPDYDPAAITAGYERMGASAVSVLTEPRHFLGSLDHLRAVRSAVQLPVLRKDFTCDEFQLVEAAACGADLILLIVAALGDDELQTLYGAARALRLEVLVESHTAEELARALRLPEAIVGVNSRNLKTLTTDLAVAHALSAQIPPERLSIAESGISQRSEIESLQACGYRGFLIGEALVSNDDPAGRLSDLLGNES